MPETLFPESASLLQGAAKSAANLNDQGNQEIQASGEIAQRSTAASMQEQGAMDRQKLAGQQAIQQAIMKAKQDAELQKQQWDYENNITVTDQLVQGAKKAIGVDISSLKNTRQPINVLNGLLTHAAYQKGVEDAIQGRKDVAVMRGDTNIGIKDLQQQDKLEEQYRKSFQQTRGDQSLKRIEEQRDAASIAYNRIKEVKDRGQVLNPVDYVDILGQIYKSRTGSAPTEEILKSARQSTLKGNFGKAFTLVTGEQSPATTKNIMDSLQNMALSMGSQADKLHEGYMRSRSKPPLSLAPDRVANVNSERGMSFSEATGQNQQGGGGLSESEKAELAILEKKFGGGK